MKIKKVFIIATLFILTLFSLVGCNFTMYKVSFESNGGSNVSSKMTTGIVARPTAPTKDGYTFAGWYLDSELTQEFDFKTSIVADTTLYAKWVVKDNSDNNNQNNNQTDNPDNNNQNNQGDNQQVQKYIVSFETNGGTPIESVEVSDKVTKPANPTKDDYRFDGWFSDANFANEFDFSKTINQNITLYAKWTRTHTDYYEGTYNNDPIDPYILAMDFSSKTITTSTEYAYYLDYAVLNRLDKIELTTVGISGEAFNALTSEAIAKMKIHIDCGFNFSLLGDKLTTTLSYSPRALQAASIAPAYEQIPFVCNVKASTRTEEYNSFKINNLTNTYPVTDTDQLCYVLEHGYKPAFTSESCTAKRIYDIACNVLIDICDDSFTDIEKLHAIYDWLINTVTYDGALFDKVLNGESDLEKYNGFYLEGVFDDQRAVCDGISKAFMVLARIEGIECVQVSGNAVSNNVGHAWNKVRLEGRWYIVDATGGGVIVGQEKEMLTHRTFMCNEEYYNTKYRASNYVEFVADSEYSFYCDLTFTYKDLEYDFYIEDVSELADILSYYKSLNDNSKTIDFYYAGSIELSSAIQSAMRNAHLSGSYSTVQNDGSIIFKFAN